MQSWKRCQGTTPLSGQAPGHTTPFRGKVVSVSLNTTQQKWPVPQFDRWGYINMLLLHAIYIFNVFECYCDYFGLCSVPFLSFPFHALPFHPWFPSSPGSRGWKGLPAPNDPPRESPRRWRPWGCPPAGHGQRWRFDPSPPNTWWADGFFPRFVGMIALGIN